MSDNPRKKRLRIFSTAAAAADDDDDDYDDDDDDNLERIPLMGFGTYEVKSPQVIYNALSVGYRHLDLAENYNNLHHIKLALLQALAPLTEGGLGIERKAIWITMKVTLQSINKIDVLLAAVGTDYFNLLLYHYPFSMFDSKAQLKLSWLHMNKLKQWWRVKRIGVSNFYGMLVIIFAYSNVTFSAPTNGYSNALLLNAGFGQATWLNAVYPMRE